MKLTEYIAITLNEKTCLSVCRRRQCPTERCDLLGTERGDPVSTETLKHRLGLCSTIKKSKFLQSAWQKLINTNFKQLEPKKFNNEINSFFMNGYCSKNSELREAHQKSLSEMDELKKCQSSTFDTVARRKFVEDQDTVLELVGRTQELQNDE